MKLLSKGSKIKMGIFGDILFIIFLTCVFQYLLHSPALLLGRHYAINQADRVIQYLEKEKKENGEYPSIDVNTIANPGFAVTGGRYYYYCKADGMKSKKSVEQKKELEKENDYFVLRFAQGAGFIDQYMFLYRSDGDYSKYRNIQDAPNNWKYYFDHF